jgi:hypothetical protein
MAMKVVIHGFAVLLMAKRWMPAFGGIAVTQATSHAEVRV